MTAFDWDYVPYVFCGGYTHLQGSAAGRSWRTMPSAASSAIFSAATCCCWEADGDHPAAEWIFRSRTWTIGCRVKPFLAFRPDRIQWDEVEAARRAQAQGSLVVAHMPEGAFDLPRGRDGERRSPAWPITSSPNSWPTLSRPDTAADTT